MEAQVDAAVAAVDVFFAFPLSRQAKGRDYRYTFRSSFFTSGAFATCLHHRAENQIMKR